MKKIQVSSVEKTCNIEIIELNSYLITKAVKAKVYMEMIAGPLKKTRRDSESGEEKISYNTYIDSEENSRILVEEILPFLSELVDAFEGKE